MPSDPNTVDASQALEELLQALTRLTKRAQTYLSRNAEDSGRDDPLELIEQTEADGLTAMSALTRLVACLRIEEAERVKTLEEVASHLRAIHKQLP